MPWLLDARACPLVFAEGFKSCRAVGCTDAWILDHVVLREQHWNNRNSIFPPKSVYVDTYPGGRTFCDEFESLQAMDKQA